MLNQDCRNNNPRMLRWNDCTRKEQICHEGALRHRKRLTSKLCPHESIKIEVSFYCQRWTQHPVQKVTKMLQHMGVCVCVKIRGPPKQWFPFRPSWKRYPSPAKKKKNSKPTRPIAIRDSISALAEAPRRAFSSTPAQSGRSLAQGLQDPHPVAKSHRGRFFSQVPQFHPKRKPGSPEFPQIPSEYMAVAQKQAPKNGTLLHGTKFAPHPHGCGSKPCTPGEHQNR